MPEFSRRGFLQTLAAAAGAAIFNPATKLWVPGAPKELIVPTFEGTTIAQVIEEQVELNDLAMAFARRMTERLARHKAIALREVMFRHAGTVNLPPDTLDIDQLGVGRFEPMSVRLMPSGELAMGKAGQKQFIDDMSWLLADKILHEGCNIDMFAPMGVELRPGVPFSGDTNIGTAVDPQSGLSVRVLRFDQSDKRGGTTTRYGVEMAGGRWLVPVRKPRPVYDDYGDRIEYDEGADDYVITYASADEDDGEFAS